MVEVLTHAGQMRFSLALAEQPALRTCRVRAGDLEVELRLLAGSHQAVVHGAGATLCESVGVLPGSDSAVPGWLERHEGGCRYVFRSCVQRPGAEALRARACVLRAHAHDDPSVILEARAGPDDALTALACRSLPGGVAWSTWHVYPGSGEVVVTRSRVVGAR